MFQDVKPGLQILKSLISGWRSYAVFDGLEEINNYVDM